MIRHFNYTRRKRIQHRHIEIAVRPESTTEHCRFTLNRLDLTSYDFPPDALVRLCAYRSNLSQRWELGTVAHLRTLSDAERRMVEVDERAQFQVFVVAGDDSGRLLGLADRIRPTLPQESLIALSESHELGDEIWRIDFGDGNDRPILEVNAKVEGAGMSEIVRRDGAFRSLVMPQVLRAVLHQIVFDARANPDHDEDGVWWDGWFRLAATLVPSAKPPYLEDPDDNAQADAATQWIDTIVAAFSSSSVKALPTYNQYQRQRS